MRVKRQKRHRKIVRFYTACFGFRDPYKVLCDGTFVRHLLVNNITPADTAVSNVLGAEVKMFTTRCVLAELNSLREADSLNAARNLIPARCDHEKRKSAVDCIMEVIGENNQEHFFVATQDADLRKKFQEIPGVPVIYGLRKALLLEPPSTCQHRFAKSAEEERSHMTELELKMLKMKNSNRLVIKGGREDSPDAREGVGDKTSGTQIVKLRDERKRIDVKDRVQFKRKKAKGPNPLSCKKKKSCKNQNNVPQKETKDAEQAMRNRSRKRKRSRKTKNAIESTG